MPTAYLSDNGQDALPVDGRRAREAGTVDDVAAIEQEQVLALHSTRKGAGVISWRSAGPAPATRSLLGVCSAEQGQGGWRAATHLGMRHGLELLEEGEHVRVVGLVGGLVQVAAQPGVHVCEVHNVDVVLQHEARDARVRLRRRRPSLSAASAMLHRDGRRRSQQCQNSERAHLTAWTPLAPSATASCNKRKASSWGWLTKSEPLAERVEKRARFGSNLGKAAVDRRHAHTRPAAALCSARLCCISCVHACAHRAVCRHRAFLTSRPASSCRPTTARNVACASRDMGALRHQRHRHFRPPEPLLQRRACR